MFKSLILKLKKHKTLVSNFNYLTILKLFQLLFPLITYPYLIRVLGNEIYGVVAYSQALIAYLLVFIMFGFNISEIKEISTFRDVPEKISKILSSVLIIKISFAILAIAILLFLVYLIPALNQHKWLYIAYIGILIDGAINPTFYFQGIEKMKVITILTITSKVIFLILIFILVQEPSDYLLVPLFTSIGALIASIIGLIIVFVKYKVRLVSLSIGYLKSVAKDNIPFFMSRISVIAINKTNVLLLGTFVGYSEVAYYDLAEKLTNVLKVPFNIFNSVLFPNVSKTKNISLVLKTLKPLLIVYILGYLSLYIFGDFVIKIIGGIELIPAKYVLYVLGFSIITELISVFIGAPILLVMGYKKIYNNSIIFGSLFYLLLIVILYSFNMIGLYSLALTTVLASSFIMIYRLNYCKKYNLI